jgi:hypothetical protein
MRFVVAVGVSVLACSSPAKEQAPAAERSTSSEKHDAKKPSVAVERDAADKPRGWQAYQQRAGKDAGSFETARDATVVGIDGKNVQLADLWRQHNVALVFYRGHW